jgi:hypothetical protein
MWMTKDKIDVVDKLQSSRFSDPEPVGGLECKEIVQLFAVSARPDLWVELRYASFEQHVAFGDFLIVVDR